MFRKVILWLSIIIVLLGWPVSIIVNPPKFSTQTIFNLSDAAKEKEILLQKLGLSASPLKKIFYNTKTTIVFDRYGKNILSLVNFNNFFFNSFPQTDVTENNHRAKFIYPAIFAFLVGIYISIKKKTHTKLWRNILVTTLLISLFKNVDGWDTLLFPGLSIITIDGIKEIYKKKYGIIILILIVIFGFFEIWRVLT